jgi:hypothetical protein
MYFLYTARKAFLEENKPLSTMSTLIGRMNSFEKLLKEKICYMFLLLMKKCFFGEIHVFLPLSWIQQYGTKWANLHLENPHLQEVILTKTNQIQTGKQCARCCSFFHRWFSCRDKYVLQLLECAYLEESDHISNLKNLSCRNYSIQNSTQCSQGNNMLECPDSNTDRFISRDICVSSSWMHRTIGKK